MSRRTLLLVATFLALISVGGYHAGRHTANAAAGAAKAPARRIDLTIYSQDFALVDETRSVDLREGRRRLSLTDISRELDPHSVLLKWKDTEGGNPPQIIGHSYDLGVADSQGLLKHEVGKTVELIRYGDNGQEASRQQGRLLVADGGSPAVIEIAGKLYVNPEGTLVVDGSDSTPTIPQLKVQLRSDRQQSGSMELTYLTRGLRWSADYVATLDTRQDDRMNLECYATITNRTGVLYPGSRINLIAGTPNRAATVRNWRVKYDTDLVDLGGADATGVVGVDRVPSAASPRVAALTPTTVADFHSYPLKERATIYSEQLNRLLMLKRDGLKIKKDYSYRAPYLYSYDSESDNRGKVAVSISFMNDKDGGLALPLPAGTIRVYDPDDSGKLRYGGAAEVPETATNKKVSVTLANAFDVTAEYRTVSSKKIRKRLIRKEIEVVLQNERATLLPVRVVQGFYGRWNVAKSSHKHVKLDSSTAQWTIAVPAEGKTVLTYAVDLSG